MSPVRTFRWLNPDGEPVGCGEKLKVLEQNLQEFEALVLDQLEDAALMGCDVEQFRQALAETLAAVSVRYTKS
jgi:DNA-binding ferritin-like protein (Dps family)